MPALRYSEDTEFNDALRARGILPPLPNDESLSAEEPSKAEEEPTVREIIEQVNSSKGIDEVELDDEDEIPVDLIDSWKQSRLSELRHAQQISNAHLPGLKPIGKEDYLREVNQASEVDIDPTRQRKGTGVVICLWNNSSASKHILTLLDSLSNIYPSTRFLSIPGSSCIANFPDVNQPTLICYRAGHCLRQYIGIGSNLEISKSNGRLCHGTSATLQDLEVELAAIGVLDDHLKKLPTSATTNHDLDSDDDDVDPRHISKSNIRAANNHHSDSELDI